MTLTGCKKGLRMKPISEYLKNITDVHIELTDKCQAACPMCARNHNGGSVRPFIQNSEITIDKFKEWFPVSFIRRLNNFYSCGNYGDPAFAKDCFEIYEYVRKHNSKTRLAFHTNGSLRKPEWWKELAAVIGDKGEVIFAVDGIGKNHELYRRNTSYEKVMENIKAFVDAGGIARADSLIFKHNENDFEELQKILYTIGVKEVNIKSTTRFYDLLKFPVHDKDGNLEYYLEPTTIEQYKQKSKIKLENFLDEEFTRHVASNSNIKPKCVDRNEIYVDPHGNILPCCWIGSDWIEQPLQGDHILQKLRNMTVSDSQNVFKTVGVPNLNNKNIEQILRDEQTWNTLNDYWYGKNKCLTCVKNCSAELYDY